jgi:Flp pilus assembly secretin CpaC
MEETNKNTQLLIIATIIFLISSLSYAAGNDAQNRKIDIQIGTQSTLEIPGDKISRVEVSDSDILNAKVSGNNGVILTGLKKGVATVAITKQTSESTDYIITTWNVSLELIEDYIKDIPGVRLIRTGSVFSIMGETLTNDDFLRIKKLADRYPDDIKELVNQDPSQANRELERIIRKDINNPNVYVNITREGLTLSVVLKGEVYTQEDKDRAKEIAMAYIGEKGTVSNSITVMDLLVEMNVVFAKVIPSSSSEIGADTDNLGVFGLPELSLTLKKTDTAPGGQLSVGSLSYGISSPKFKALNTKGIAKVLDTAYIAAKSGKTGFVQRGGTMYVKTSGTTSGDLVPVEFGLILKVTPVVKPILGSDNKPKIGEGGKPEKVVDFEMELEVSQPITASGGADIQVDKFKTSTFGSVKENQTLVISGLRQISRARSKKTVPIVGDMPLLNLFFGREDKETNQTDIAVFITPKVVKYGDYVITVTPEEAEKAYQDAKSANLDIDEAK